MMIDIKTLAKLLGVFEARGSIARMKEDIIKDLSRMEGFNIEVFLELVIEERDKEFSRQDVEFSTIN